MEWEERLSTENWRDFYAGDVAHVVLTGGAGFVGSHLCDALIARGDRVTCIDNLSSGQAINVSHLLDNDGFSFMEADVRHSPLVEGPVDSVMHFASPASPPHYLEFPMLTLETGSIGTQWCLELAKANNARFMMASTSEVYGDPAVHPQVEGYWGNVNPIGPRSVYDEAKRYAEAITMAYNRTFNVDTSIIRIFNTYGPRMRADDGRVVSNFINQALTGQPITIFGDGEQTRSFCFVSDLVTGILAMLDSGHPGPVNLGNPVERTVKDLADIVLRLIPSDSTLGRLPLPTDDPTRRKPDISLATNTLGWTPQVSLEEGLVSTIEHFASLLPDPG